MEVRPGYKQTEVGVIPEEWEVKRLADVGDIRSGGTPTTTEAHLWNGGVPWCTPTDITGLRGRKYLTATARTISAAGLQFSAAEVIPPRSLIMTSRATIGECAINVIPMTTNQGFKNIVPFSDVDVEFLYYKMTTQKVGLIALCGGSTFLEIGKKQLRDYRVAVPKDQAEQRAIAAALSDVDTLLGRLDRLIAKKRDLKQAAMQQLLTGQTRLPGFHAKNGFQRSSVGLIPEDWRCLGVPQVVSGNSDSIKIGPFGSALKKEFLVATGYKVYGQENLYAKDMALGVRYISHSRFMELRACEIRPGDFLISMMGTVGKCLVAPEGIEAGIMDSHLLRLRLAPEVIDAAFLTHVFETPVILRQVKQLSVGGIMEGLSSKIIRGIALPVPSVPEQAAIAVVLSDMDAELAALQARRDKTRDLKQAMMQELLTGKTRLVPAGATHV